MFAPSAFVWPEVHSRWTPHRIALCYPARGFGSLRQRAGTLSVSALEALLGRNRVRLLRALDRPVVDGQLPETAFWASAGDGFRAACRG